MNIIDRFLNNITMYRLVLYGLLVMAAYSFVASFLSQISFTPFELFILLATLLLTCFVSNLLFAKVFRAPVNSESSLITAIILYFLLWPSAELNNIILFAVASIIAMLSKFVIAYKRKHIFNPAAFAAFALFFLNSGGIWWVATPVMLPVTLVVGLLIVRKIRKFTMFLTFLIVTTVSFLLQGQARNLNLIDEAYQFFVSFPVIFFGTIMLTEPLTTPPTKKLQMIYATIIGLLFSYQGSSGPIIMTTELVLLIGNVFSFIVSPKRKLFIKAQTTSPLAHDTKEFVFPKPSGFTFKPGQYMEWTVPMLKTDSRGNRRYFTLASSPTEDSIRLGIKFNEPPSSFKKFLKNLKKDDTIVAGQLAGDFILPQDPSKKLVFIAGGIGVTPFRSMIKYLIDKGEKRDIVFFYSNKTAEEIAYKDIFAEAEGLGIKVIYVLTDHNTLPSKWSGESGRIDETMLKRYVPDLDRRTFYLSGPNAMVEGYKKLLRKLNIPPTSIVTDYFPGF